MGRTCAIFHRYPPVAVAVGILMPASPPLPSLPVRRGVTLLELLVVLVLMGIAAAVVAPALRPPAEGRIGAQRSPATAETLVAEARRTAIRRGEPLRLRLDPDGAWALVTFREGEILTGGRIDLGASATALDLRIDAMGSCTPAGGLDARLRAEGRTFDPLACDALRTGTAGREARTP